MIGFGLLQVWTIREYIINFIMDYKSLILITFSLFFHKPIVTDGLSFIVWVNKIIIIFEVERLKIFVNLIGSAIFLMGKVGILLSELKVNQEIGVMVMRLRPVFVFVDGFSIKIHLRLQMGKIGSL
jgi:hypothetical protein